MRSNEGPDEPDPPRTACFADFAGRRRRFQLRFGEIEELEDLARAGIGEIQLRLATNRFRQADIRETVRLGLQGGGASEAEATALVMRYVDGVPFSETIGLAAEILNAVMAGIPKPSPGKDQAESDTDPATSPPSSEPEPWLESPQSRSEQ